MNTTAIGDRANAHVLAALLKWKTAVLIPFGDGLRYDLVFEDQGQFFRVQSKHGIVRDGAVRFRATSTTGKGKARIVKNYRGGADYFGVYVSATNRTYLVPVADVGVSVATLRLVATRNGQKARVRWARDYELVRP